MSYTKLDLLQDLADMGLTGQETILIHSSMKSIGPVDGGVDTVLDALMEFFRPGLLLLPQGSLKIRPVPDHFLPGYNGKRKTERGCFLKIQTGNRCRSTLL